MQPPGFSADAWHAVYGNLTSPSQLGTTWGGYVQMLDNEAAYLGHLGENVNDVGQLWGFAVSQADNALLPLGQFSAVTDIGLPSPGDLSLSFARQDLVAIHDRYTYGPLGYGWNDNWQYSLAKAADDAHRIGFLHDRPNLAGIVEAGLLNEVLAAKGLPPVAGGVER